MQQQLAPCFVGHGELIELVAFQFGVGAHPARGLAGTGGGDAAGDFGAAFGGRGQRHVDRADGCDMDMQVDPVEQRAGQPRLIIAHAARIFVAVARRIARIAAAAGVHRRHELHPRRESHMSIGARDIDLAGFERLAQRIEHRALEFGQFIQEQDAQMRQTDLTGAHLQSAAGQRRHAGRVVRCAERTGAADPPCLQRSGDRLHHRHLQRLGRGEFGQNAGQAGCKQALARSGRADHQQVVAPGGRDFERAFGGFLPLHLFQVRRDPRIHHFARWRF